MSGHSKWNNIKRKKEKTDGARAKIFTKIGRELAVAVKEGGSADPAANSKLKDVIAKAKANNVPNDNIERIIKKAAGEGNSNAYESITYEGYGPAGVAAHAEAVKNTKNAAEKTLNSLKEIVEYVNETRKNLLAYVIAEGFFYFRKF